jgi:spermidine synthase
MRRVLEYAGAALLALWALPAPAAVVHEVFSAYHHIQVRDEAGMRILSFNGSQETRMSLLNHLEGHFDYTEYFHIPAVLNPGLSNVLMIGLGGGSTQRAYAYYYPRVRVDTVEIDPEVVLIARRFFGVLESPQHRIHVADGRVFLRRNPTRYDAILMDAYQTGRYGSDAPHHLVTQEFFQLASTNLTTNGVIMYNVIGTLGGWKADRVGSLYRTMKSVFPQVYWFAAENSMNVVLLGTKTREPLTLAELRQKYEAQRKRQVLMPPSMAVRVNAFRTNAPPAAARAPLLTDKYVPPTALR